MPSGEERLGLARPPFSAVPSREADQARSSNAEGIDALFQAPGTRSCTNALRTHHGDGDPPPADARRGGGYASDTSIRTDALRSNKRRREDPEYFPSERERRKRTCTRPAEPSDDNNCLRVQSVCLLLDDESFRYEWSRHRKQWECKDPFGMDPVVSDVMNDLFVQPGAGLLRVLVRVDDQLLDFEWIPENRHWNAVDVDGRMVYLEARMVCDAVFEPMNSLWANVY